MQDGLGKPNFGFQINWKLNLKKIDKATKTEAREMYYTGGLNTETLEYKTF